MARSGTFDVELRAFVMRLLDRAEPGQTGWDRPQGMSHDRDREAQGLQSSMTIVAFTTRCGV